MQLLKLDTTGEIQIKSEIKHKRFKDVIVNKVAGKERHIEDLIIAYPGLLNFGDFAMDGQANNDLLIISRQAQTSRKKRADLFAIDQDGYLVVIENKRDAADEKGRIEGAEFQAIRYAAASRKLTVDAIIDLFAKFLQSANQSKQQSADQWRSDAIKLLCDHLSDEEAVITYDKLPEIIIPRKKQKIYLVAADYEEEVVSACAWLREHNIDIYCFRLRPYQIGADTILERERLIPPPELDDLMVDFFKTPTLDAEASTSSAPKAPSNKPTKMTWTGDEPVSQSITTWRGLVECVVRKALEEGILPKDLPMPTANESDTESHAIYLSPAHFPSHQIYANFHGSAATIQDWIKDIIAQLQTKGKKLGLLVDTANGVSMEF